jgi:hypothetical protein
MVSKEDIIEQGFNLLWENVFLSVYLCNKPLTQDHKNGVELIYYPPYCRMIIQSDEKHFECGERVYFDGYINNKEEFVLLIKMLKIIKHDSKEEEVCEMRKLGS